MLNIYFASILPLLDFSQLPTAVLMSVTLLSLELSIAAAEMNEKYSCVRMIKHKK